MAHQIVDHRTHVGEAVEHLDTSSVLMVRHARLERGHEGDELSAHPLYPGTLCAHVTFQRTEHVGRRLIGWHRYEPVARVAAQQPHPQEMFDAGTGFRLRQQKLCGELGGRDAVSRVMVQNMAVHPLQRPL
ncbi:hypothetical protein GCM10010521_44590 [Streptomyces rameus]|uniref:Uncharacterized protein n=1 Tax=Streptomyces rameus TaxID=68261 RepID=A0ABP6NMZ2_9ACTN